MVTKIKTMKNIVKPENLATRKAKRQKIKKKFTSSNITKPKKKR